MKLDLPVEVIEDCLLNSPKFRLYVARQCAEAGESSTLMDIRFKISDICAKNRGNKIAAIKEIREFSKGNIYNVLRAYANLIDFGNHTFYDDNSPCLGLADSKKIAEYAGNFN